MIYILSGSRSLTDKNFIFNILKQYLTKEDELIHGGAIGVDTIGGKYCEQNNIVCEIYRPDYKRYHKKIAPKLRNIIMCDIAEEMIAIWDGNSPGTLHAIEYMKKIGKKIYLYEYPNKIPLIYPPKKVLDISKNAKKISLPI